MEIVLRFFPSFIDTLPSLSRDAKMALWELGITTPRKMAAASDAELLAIKGVGPAKLAKMRDTCASHDDPEQEYVDRVER